MSSSWKTYWPKNCCPLKQRRPTIKPKHEWPVMQIFLIIIAHWKQRFKSENELTHNDNNLRDFDSASCSFPVSGFG